MSEKLFGNIEKGVFISRPNRFVLKCRLDGKIIDTYLPNPGRLWELLFPEKTIVYLEKSDNSARKIPWTAVAVEKNGLPVMLHTHKTNDAVQHLLEIDAVPGLEGARIVRREVTRGKSRFDFLLELGSREILLEVKSCSLFSRRVAMFPDAITARGKRHLEELAELTTGNTKGVVLFLINSPDVELFSPEYHTDIEFARTLYAVKSKVDIIPLAVGWNTDLTLKPGVKRIDIPWEVVEKESIDGGSYLIIFKVDKDIAIDVGSLGKISFNKGYYIYTGSAKRGLTSRIERHKRLRKNKHWHIDYLREGAEVYASLPFRTTEDIECRLASCLSEMADSQIDRFGSTDCHCPSHLFFFENNPLHSQVFHELLERERMDRPFLKTA